jgi:S-formylglutathione hydrolase FrmB
MHPIRFLLAGMTLCVMAFALAFGPSTSVTAQSPAPAWVPADTGARIMRADRLDDRMVDLVIQSPGVGIQKVRLLLPAGYDSGAGGHWPVLYLLHGSMDDYTSWTRETDVEDLTADLPILVVMPAAGKWGWYTDWWEPSECGGLLWETFHVTELRQLLERNWQAGDERAVAGVSMGGFGAMSYAGRHPDLFKAAASFSGMLDLSDSNLGSGDAIWGPKGTVDDTRQAHDPVALAPALREATLYVSYGSGDPGSVDDAEPSLDQREQWLAGTSEAFVTRLSELGIPVTVDAYDAGEHDWSYWERSLQEAMPQLLEALGA